MSALRLTSHLCLPLTFPPVPVPVQHFVYKPKADYIVGIPMYVGRAAATRTRLVVQFSSKDTVEGFAPTLGVPLSYILHVPPLWLDFRSASPKSTFPNPYPFTIPNCPPISSSFSVTMLRPANFQIPMGSIWDPLAQAQAGSWLSKLAALGVILPVMAGGGEGSDPPPYSSLSSQPKPQPPKPAQPEGRFSTFMKSIVPPFFRKESPNVVAEKIRVHIVPLDSKKDVIQGSGASLQATITEDGSEYTETHKVSCETAHYLHVLRPLHESCILIIYPDPDKSSPDLEILSGGPGNVLVAITSACHDCDCMGFGWNDGMVLVLVEFGSCNLVQVQTSGQEV
ncbi:hypothetical protein F5880DRAFT_1509028 [Lentinula raphanica]|nr:hypothetical protein F5880DRAFT_1509028 [Lentinula raphanica]